LRAILIEQLIADREFDERENLYLIRKHLEQLPEYIKSLVNVHGTRILQYLGYGGDPILPQSVPEEKVGDKRVVKTLYIGGRTVKVLKK
jgi:hypothetical protein